MIPNSIAHACSSVLANLAAPAARSLLLACFTALALGLLRVKGVAARLAVWTAVLYAALAMPFLGVMLPSISLKIPQDAGKFISQRFSAAIMPLAADKPAEARVIPPSPVVVFPDAYATDDNSRISPKRYLHRNRDRASLNVAPILADRGSIAGSAPFSYSRSAIVPAASLASANSKVPRLAIAAAIYFVVTILFLARLVLGFLFSRRLVRSAQPIIALEAACPLAIQAREAGLLVIPDLAESAAISVPVTMGILRPVILFPFEWREWDVTALHAVIAHELSHVIRRDALTQRLSLFHRAIFWFSPLSWWLHRRLADVAEEASDEAALVSGADRARYAETLLGFFAVLQETPRRVYWHGVSMAKAGQAEKRVDRILAWKGDVGMRMNKFLIIIMILAGVPTVIFTAAARPSLRDTSVVDTQAPGSQAAEQTVNPAPNPAPATSPVPRTPATPRAPETPQTLRTPQTPATSEAPAPVTTPAIPVAPSAVAAPPLPFQMLPPIPPAAPVEPKAVVAPDVRVQLRDFMADPDVRVQLKNFMTDEQIQKIQKQLNEALARAQSARVQLKDSITDEQIQKIRKQLNEALAHAQDTKVFAQAEKSLDEAQKNLELKLKDIQKDGIFQMPFAGPVKIVTDGFSDRFVIVSGDSPIFMSGDSQDVEHATSLRGKISGDFIWFQRDEKSYIIRDKGVVNSAKELFKPQQDLGEKQQALGKQQQALGDQQRGLGEKMRTVQVQLPDMSADMQKLDLEMKQLSAGATQQQVGDLQRQIGELQRKIGQVQSQAGEQMRKDSEPMRALGEQQRALGQQQRELGQQQREAGRQARVQMKQLLDDAVTKGTAQPE